MLSHHSPGDDESFAAICREQRWKRTIQRRAVFNYLCGNREHPSVESIWHGVRAAVPDVSLDSVYRILDDFSSAGLIRRLEGMKVIRYDPDTRPHEHFVCSRCGRMDDFTCLDPDWVSEHCHGFGQIDSVELTVRGVCRLCLEKDHSAGGKR